MTSQDLKEYIYKNNKVEYILEQLGCHSIKFHEDKDIYTSTQPDGNNIMGVVIKNNEYLNYYSYSRGINVEEGRDIFSLIQDTKKISFSDTMKYTHKLFGLDYKFNKNKKDVIEKPDPLAIFKRASSKKRTVNVLDFEPLDESVLLDFTPIIYIDLFREGIIATTIKKFELGYSYKWKRTIFPHRYWLDGSLLGYNGRTSIEDYDEFGIKKYYITPGMPKEINLYGLWENYNDIQKAGYVVVYESEKSVLKRDSRCDSTGVAVSGHHISDEQVRILIGLNVDIIISMDNDVDINEIRHICEKLWMARNVYYTYDKHNILPPKSSIADANNQVFDYFIKHKIKYDKSEHNSYLKSLKK